MAELPEAAEVRAPVVVDLGLGWRAELQVAHAAQRIAQLPVLLLQLQLGGGALAGGQQIGRASCRERVSSPV